MIDRSFFLSGLLILASGFSSAQTTGIEQNLEFLTPSTGGKYLRWYGDADRSYFLQISEPSDPLKTWFWAPLIEAGNDEDISFEVDGTADKGFFRLHYTNQLPGSGQTLENADFDGDGFSNLYEITLRPRPGGIVGFPTLSPNIQTNPLRTDTDSDGLGDKWEEDNSLDPTDNGSRNSNNGPNGDPDLDGLSNLYEYWYGADPQLADTDGDGINDLDEVTIHYTSPTSSDSDWDGLGDFDEIFTHGTQPWNWDTDDDTLSDGDEINTHLTNPLETDTDGDWMWDDYELANSLDPTDPADGMADADGDTLANQLEFVYLDQGFDPVAVNNAAVFPWAGDPDWDGLNTQVEFVTHLTNPRQPDTDDDGLSDGWEILYVYSALINNETDANSGNDPSADPDGDGLNNAAEDQIETNPNNADTDGDSNSDFAEAQGGSNPKNAASTPANPGGASGGPTTPLPPLVSLQVNFGDHSGSHSEKFRVWLEPLSGDANTQKRFRSNRKYGGAQIETLKVPAGAKYKVTLSHIGTDPKYRGEPKPDYDYTLEFPPVITGSSAIAVIPEDPNSILGIHDEGQAFFAAGKDATLNIAWLTSETVAKSPADRARLKLGVGEEVELKVSPSLVAAAWTTMVGTLNATTGTSVLLTLDDTVGVAKKVSVDYLGKTLEKEYEIVAPTGIDHADIASTHHYPVGEASAGMHLYPVVVAPIDVSFYNVQMLEVGQGATSISGYFLTNTPISHVGHGADVWFDLDEKNQWPTNWDHAELTNWPAPWSTGGFTWLIPAKWKVVSPLATSPEHTIAGWDQVFSIDAAGTITINKFNHHVTRTTADSITSQ